jgi:HlyD family secretion protein
VIRRLSFLALLFAPACHARPSNRIEGTGTLELTEIDVAPLVMARVTKVWRQEGERVRAGDTLVTLTQAAVHTDVAVQQAAVQAADARLRDLLAGPRPSEIAQADADARAADAEATRAAQDLDRLTPLAASGTVSKQQLDAARAASRAATDRRDAARERARLVREGARPDQIQAARAAVAQARAAVTGAQQNAADLVLTAPVEGTVLSRHAEPGEVLAPGVSTMTIGEVARPYVRIYVDELAFPRIRLGDTASVYLDAMPDRAFRGVVTALSDRAEFTPRVALTRDERADLVFGVKIQLTDTTTTLKAGLPVTVRFTTRAERASR